MEAYNEGMRRKGLWLGFWGGPNHGADRTWVGKECHLSGCTDDQGFRVIRLAARGFREELEDPEVGAVQSQGLRSR